MKKRLTQPKNNKYYIRLVTGGYNGAVAGSPTIAGANVLCNCVGYANGRFNEIIGDPDLKGVAFPFKYQLTCNAENFIESAKSQGLKISKTPVVGGIMVWQKGATLGGGDGAGHVAVVEAVYDDGTILTSESGWASWAFKTIRRDNTNGRWGQNYLYKFRGCIINPSVKSKTVPAPKLVVDGIGGDNTVRAMQRFFGTPCDGVIGGQVKNIEKVCPSLEAFELGRGGSPCIKKLQKWVGVTQDGVIGVKTVKAWQKKIGVKSDGIFGTISMKEWQKYLNEHDKPTYPKKKKKSIFYATTVKIGQACCNEKGTLSGGKPGDQTGYEVCITKWSSSYGWIYMFRAKDKSLRTRLALKMIDTCENEHIGYNIDIPARYVAYDQAVKHDGDIKAITKNGDTTCSQAISMCMRSAGIPKKYAPRHMDIDTMTEVMLNSPYFKCYKGKDYTQKSANLEVGDILLSSHHTAMVVKTPRE